MMNVKITRACYVTAWCQTRRVPSPHGKKSPLATDCCQFSSALRCGGHHRTATLTMPKGGALGVHFLSALKVTVARCFVFVRTRRPAVYIPD